MTPKILLILNIITLFFACLTLAITLYTYRRMKRTRRNFESQMRQSKNNLESLYHLSNIEGGHTLIKKKVIL